MWALAPSSGFSDNAAPCAAHQPSLASFWIFKTCRRCHLSQGTASHILPYNLESRVCDFGIELSYWSQAVILGRWVYIWKVVPTGYQAVSMAQLELLTNNSWDIFSLFLATPYPPDRPFLRKRILGKVVKISRCCWRPAVGHVFWEIPESSPSNAWRVLDK